MKRSQRSKSKNRQVVTVGNVTVRIYQRNRPTIKGKIRTVFEVADYTSGTRRLRGFTDRALAVKEAERIAGLIASGQVEAAGMRGQEAASYGRAVELLRPTGVSLELAAGTFARAFEILGEDRIIEAAQFYCRHRADKIIPRPVADVVAELVAHREAKGASIRYLGDLRARLNRFAQGFAVDIGTISTSEVQRWLDGLKLSPQSTKNFRTVLFGLFSFAEARGYILKGANPVADTESVKVNGGAVEIFTPKEIAALLNAAPADFLPVLALGAFAGLRSAEIQRLEWSDVNFDEGHIIIGRDKAKTGSRRLVPLLPNLRAWLAPCVKRKGKVWHGTATDLQEARAATVKAAGVEWKDNALRHSFVSYRLAVAKNAAQVSLEAGNSAKVVFRHYRELVTEQQGNAWFAITPEGKGQS